MGLSGWREQPAEGLLALSPSGRGRELRERVNLWYALVLCETSVGLSTGLPSVPADVCSLLVSVEHVLSFTLILSSIVPP